MSFNSHIRHSVTIVIATGCLAVVGAQHAYAESVPTDMLSAKFPICSDRRRVKCVVDGDTFWFRRQKVRMADIDAPELNPPRFADERQRGEAAKLRLQALLNAGPFSLEYGAGMRIVKVANCGS